jgi:hypothetical protein
VKTIDSSDNQSPLRFPYAYSCPAYKRRAPTACNLIKNSAARISSRASHLKYNAQAFPLFEDNVYKKEERIYDCAHCKLQRIGFASRKHPV